MSKGLKTIRRRDPAIDVDGELGRFFSREYSFEPACSLGHAGSGGGGGSNATAWCRGLNINAAHFAGPGGYAEVTRVCRALVRLGGTPPPMPRTDTATAAARIRAEWQRLSKEWPLYLPALTAFYRPRPRDTTVLETTDAMSWLLASYGQWALVATMTPTARQVAIEWMTRRCEGEVAHFISCAEQAQEESAERLVDAFSHDRVLKKRLETYLAFDRVHEFFSEPMPARIDTESMVRSKWAREPLAGDLFESLKQLADRAKTSKDRAARESAQRRQADILREAGELLRGAKIAYERERKKVDQEIWKEHRGKKRAALHSYEQRLYAAASAEID